MEEMYGYGMAGWILAIANPIITFILTKWLTKRDKKEKDIQIVSTTVTSSIESINKLTDQVSELVTKLCAEQDKNVALLQEKSQLLKERTELTSKIDKLQKEVTALTKKIDQLTNKHKKNEN